MGSWFGGSGDASTKTNLFVPKLAADGVISEAIFSFFLSLKAADSYIDFGTPDPAIVGADQSEIVWLDVLHDSDKYEYKANYWVNEVRGLYWGDLLDDTHLYELD